MLLSSAALMGSLAPLQAQTITLRSELPAYEATAITALPPPPPGHTQECRSAPPEHSTGKAVEAAGWQVISESTLGNHNLVSFAGSSTFGPEGVCEYTAANLGVFNGDTLIGLFWSQQDTSALFGALGLGPDGAVQMSNSIFPVVPVAELSQHGEQIVLSALPATLPECGGKVEIPQAWLEPIGKMRERLLASGWNPMTPKAADPIAADMQAHGFPETESCTGTGQNYCSYDYANSHALLRVITVGELHDDHQPIVADYDLTCTENSK